MWPISGLRNPRREQTPASIRIYAVPDWIAAFSPAMTDELFIKVSKALSDPQRFALLRRIGQDAEVACMTLVAEFPITQATISHHMKELTEANLVTSRKSGKCCYFTFNASTMDEYRRQLTRALPGASAKARRRPAAQAATPESKA